MYKERLKFRLSQNKIKHFYLISPDGIAILIVSFNDAERALKAFEAWKNGYSNQGYYSSNNGRIELEDLEYHIDISIHPFKFKK